MKRDLRHRTRSEVRQEERKARNAQWQVQQGVCRDFRLLNDRAVIEQLERDAGLRPEIMRAYWDVPEVA